MVYLNSEFPRLGRSNITDCTDPLVHLIAGNFSHISHVPLEASLQRKNFILLCCVSIDNDLLGPEQVLQISINKIKIRKIVHLWETAGDLIDTTLTPAMAGNHHICYPRSRC
jgi:hypothetical protein